MDPSTGDLVQTQDSYLWRKRGGKELLGIILRVLNSDTLPCLVEVMWNDGSIRKTWTDELEIQNE